MKKKLAISAIVISSLIMQSAFGQTAYHRAVKANPVANTGEAFRVTVLPDANKEKFILVVNNPLGQTLKITIDGANSVGFYETLSDTVFRKRIDMTAAEDGGYVITVTNGSTTIRKEFTVSTNVEVVRAIAVKK